MNVQTVSLWRLVNWKEYLFEYEKLHNLCLCTNTGLGAVQLVWCPHKLDVPGRDEHWEMPGDYHSSANAEPQRPLICRGSVARPSEKHQNTHRDQKSIDCNPIALNLCEKNAQPTSETPSFIRMNKKRPVVCSTCVSGES